MSNKETTVYHQPKKNTGVILANFGSPQALSKKAIRKFLWLLLTDQRVVSLPKLVWWPILLLFILPLRPRRLVDDYRKIWTKRGSPLLVYHNDIMKSLQKKLPNLEIVEAHLYAEPTMQAAWHHLKSKGIKDVVLFPFYPQYSSATTACVFDAWAKIMKKEPFVPGLKFIQSYHDDFDFINLLAKKIKLFWQKQGRGDHLIFSFHGIPKEKFKTGDPYYCYCHKTMRLVAETLKLDEKEYSLAFQSRFGKQEWLKPYLNEHIAALIGDKKKNIDVICPGFSMDCIETSHEIGYEYAEEAHALGGQLNLIPCLNNDSDSIELYKKIILKAIS